MTRSAHPACDHARDQLAAVRAVIEGPLGEIARRLSRHLAEGWPHRALVVFTRECTGRPRKVAGPPDLVDVVTIDELDALKDTVPPGGWASIVGRFAGAPRPLWLVRDAIGTLLVLVPRAERELPSPHQLAAIFGLVAVSIRQQVTQAGPDYLAESRAASSERARATAELTAAHEAALAGILATLRAPNLDDGRARGIAAAAASEALLAVRAAQSADRSLAEESPAAAFARLREEIVPLLRDRDLAVEFVAPPPTSRPIPGEVASGARAMAHAVVLAFLNRCGSRLRIAWECDDDALVMDLRDQGEGLDDLDGLRRRLHGRVAALAARADYESVPGWGSRVTVRIPLEPPAAPGDQSLLAGLNRRQREVLALVCAGMRNKAIARELGLAESTVKFHVAGVLKKLGVATRGEAAALGLRAAAAGSRPAVAVAESG
ncbi:LuxR C-terminal-related transcriptional regulator [Nocardia farcinica]|uniref:LuxR C-terminal-related transcriptional regulator n=1 Tax=Nocardia farcinica TaxID=37329 RepID=UPI0018938AA6|nr:LuxR C-terminal-related transcriptional regulator [Nocardia farcinica]MBF6442346.1 helix-turn-helix transcriptional regulator [Nocardia farcinica]